MSQFMCVIQEQSAAFEQTSALEARLVEHHERHYPGESASVVWYPVPAGFMFTEGRQSTSSVISCALRHETTRTSRESYMRGVCDLWTDVTGCTDHEIVVSISEVESGEN